MAKHPCVYEKTGSCPILLELSNVAFQENVQELLDTCKQYLDGKISEETLLAMIDTCKEKLKLVSDKVVNKVLKDYEKTKEQNHGR